MSAQPDHMADQKPGTGIDRTLIRRLLTIPPAERVKLLVDEANNMADLLNKIRVR
jgi:hypothetical protein